MSKNNTNSAPVRKKRSQLVEIWRRMRRNRLAMLGLAIVLMLVLVAVFADQITDYDTVVIKQDIINRNQAPSAEYWFGTDELGRDIFARLVHGARVSLLVGVVAVAIALATGGTLGAIAGYFGGVVDNIIMRVMDIFLACNEREITIAVQNCRRIRFIGDNEVFIFELLDLLHIRQKWLRHTITSKIKREPPQELPRSQAPQASAT